MSAAHDRVKLQAEVSQSAQDEGRQIAVNARATRTVNFLRDANVAGPVKKAVEGDDRLGARQGRTGSSVATAAEGNM
jgi:hypothetical protein